MGYEAAEISVLITDDKEIAQLNTEYRNKPKPTDVLSFAFRDIKISKANSRHLFTKQHLGDLVISLETAKRQAREYKVSLYDELIRLLIHGTLHLLGYDHEGVSKTEAAKMRRMEKRLFLEIISQSTPVS